MPNVKVYNMNEFTYKENFRDQNIMIPPGGFVKMEEGEARLFFGTFAPIVLDADGNPSPEGYKKLRIELIEDGSAKSAPEAKGFTCQADGKTFDTLKELNEYVKEHHADKIIVDEEAEREITSRGRSKKVG